MLIQVMLDLMTTEDAVVTRYEFDTPCSVEEEKKNSHIFSSPFPEWQITRIANYDLRDVIHRK